MNLTHDNVLTEAANNAAIMAAGDYNVDYEKARKLTRNAGNVAQTSTTGRSLTMQTCKLNEEATLKSDQVLVDGFLDTTSMSLYLFIDAGKQGADLGPRTLSFHTAKHNHNIQQNANYLRSLTDPRNSFSRVHVYERPADASNGEAESSPSSALF